MCGIFGYSLKDSYRESLEEDTLIPHKLTNIGFIYNRHRGTDAGGWASVFDKSVTLNGGETEGKFWHLVQPGDSKELLDTNRIGTYAPIAQIVHTRAATKGAAGNNENNHPVNWGKVWITHNGTVANHEDIKREIAGIDRTKYPQVDSVAISMLLNKYYQSPIDIDLEEVAELLDSTKGSVAFASLWSDHEDLVLGRVRTSPLVIAEHRDIGLFYASESDALMAAANVVDADNEDLWEFYECEENKFFHVHRGNIISEFFEERKRQVYVTNNYSSTKKWLITDKDNKQHEEYVYGKMVELGAASLFQEGFKPRPNVHRLNKLERSNILSPSVLRVARNADVVVAYDSNVKKSSTYRAQTDLVSMLFGTETKLVHEIVLKGDGTAMFSHVYPNAEWRDYSSPFEEEKEEDTPEDWDGTTVVAPHAPRIKASLDIEQKFRFGSEPSIAGGDDDPKFFQNSTSDSGTETRTWSFHTSQKDVVVEKKYAEANCPVHKQKLKLHKDPWACNYWRAAVMDTINQMSYDTVKTMFGCEEYSYREDNDRSTRCVKHDWAEYSKYPNLEIAARYCMTCSLTVEIAKWGNTYLQNAFEAAQSVQWLGYDGLENNIFYQDFAKEQLVDMEA